MGYSGTPLSQKLGIKPGCALLLRHAPPEAAGWLEPLPAGVRLIRKAAPAGADVILLFETRYAALVQALPRVKALLKPVGGLWIAWPKKTAAQRHGTAHGIVSDLDENRIRELALAQGLVDNKVCAVSEVWSGLRLVYRLKDRPR